MYGLWTLGTQQEEGKDVSVTQCLAYGVFEGQQMKEGEDGAYEIVEGVYEPISNLIVRDCYWLRDVLPYQ